MGEQRVLLRQCRRCGLPYRTASRRTVHCSDACRFWSKVDQSDPNGCWPFLGGTRRGYGSFHTANYGQAQGAHRVVFVLTRGVEIPPGLDVLHSCDNRICCNPAHLSLGTDVENARDRVERGRQAQGTKTAQAKLNDNQVRQIRTLAGDMTLRKIALQFAVSASTVRQIVDGQTWRHVE